MPIEFRCVSCQKVLRVNDESAGMQAKCPDCGATMSVPGGDAPSEDPFAGLPQPGQPSQPGPGNPYQTPMQGQAPFRRAKILERIVSMR